MGKGYFDMSHKGCTGVWKIELGELEFQEEKNTVINTAIEVHPGDESSYVPNPLHSS